MLILSADKKSSQNVNNLKCWTILIQIRPDIWYAGMPALDPMCMLIISADNKATKGKRFKVSNSFDLDLA